MLVLRRWWLQNRLSIILLLLLLGGAWAFRQTQGAAFSEVYYWVTQPFRVKPSPEERIALASQQELEARLKELEAQNQKLQALLNYVSGQPRRGVIAPIIGRSADQWWQQFTLGRGENHGIRVGYVVAGPGGLVGRVIQVTPNTSRVLLISDVASRLGVVISRSRFLGVMRGQGNNRAVMEFFNRDPDVRRGDTVTTSTLSQLFPPGMPVGRVIAVNLTKSPAPEAVIELIAPLNFLETVVVYPYQPTQDGSANQHS